MCTKYNPYAVNRKVRFLIQDGNVARFVCKSMTDISTNEDKWKQAINVETGEVRCDCPDFRYRKADNSPDVFSPREHICKHLARAIENLREHDQLPIKRCYVCDDSLEGDIPSQKMADENGYPIPGQYICEQCISYINHEREQILSELDKVVKPQLANYLQK